MIFMTNNPSFHVYRDRPSSVKRGELTIREKTSAVLSGIRSFEPLVEIASSGLDVDKGLPQSARLKYAAKLAKSGTTDRILDHINKETDSLVKEVLIFGFVEAYKRAVSDFDMKLCTTYTAMGAGSIVQDKDNYSRKAIEQARSLLLRGIADTDSTRSVLSFMITTPPHQL